MFSAIGTILRRIDFYLRNEVYRPPSESFTTHPLRTRVYWNIRRFWSHHWLVNPSTVYYKFVYAYQRLTRGWDDRAVWSIDWWLDGMMPAMLRQLKRDKHGTPMDMFEPEDFEEDGYTITDEGHVRADARWDAIMDKMIAAFEASRRIHGVYEGELGDYPLRRPDSTSEEDWEKVKNTRHEDIKRLTQRDAVIFQEGMALFVTHYHSLWD